MRVRYVNYGQGLRQVRIGRLWATWGGGRGVTVWLGQRRLLMRRPSAPQQGGE